MKASPTLSTPSSLDMPRPNIPYLSDPADIRLLRQKIAAQTLVPLEQLDTTAKHLSPGFQAGLEDMLINGFGIGTTRLPSLTPPIAFDAYNRSFSFHIHALEPLTFLLQGYSQYGDERYLDASFAFAWDWIINYQKPLFGMPVDKALAFAHEHKGTQAWYDMGVGQRIYRLAYLADLMTRQPEKYSDIEFALVYNTILFHQELLACDSFFVGHTNHGLYQALGQLAAAKRFNYLKGFEYWESLATQRLHMMFDRSFFPSGTHREHSTGYHHMILGSLMGAKRSKLLDPQLDAQLEDAEEILAWMIAPDGSLAGFGDTDYKARVFTPPHPLEHDNRHVKYLWTAGLGGEKPLPGVKAIHDAGYVFARLFTPEEDLSKASYLAQIAGFHSRTHKHADHFSFIWYDLGKAILVDPGRFSYSSVKTERGSEVFENGFWYSDPRRIHAEKTRAHNCIEIDGRDYPRKGAKPFGSALKYAGQQNDLVVTACSTTHFRHVRHWRGVVLRSHDFLLILDWLHDRTGTEHDFKQWLHFAPQWVLEKSGKNMIARHSDGGPQLNIINLLSGSQFSDVICGQTEPDLQGWMSDRADSFIPAPCVAAQHDAGSSALFATLLVFSETAEALPLKTRTNATLSKGQVSWRDDRGEHKLNFSRDENRFIVDFDADTAPEWQSVISAPVDISVEVRNGVDVAIGRLTRDSLVVPYENSSTRLMGLEQAGHLYDFDRIETLSWASKIQKPTHWRPLPKSKN